MTNYGKHFSLLFEPLIRNWPSLITVALLIIFGVFFLHQGQIETVVFVKDLNTMFMKRFSVFHTFYTASLPLSAIEEV